MRTLESRDTEPKGGGKTSGMRAHGMSIALEGCQGCFLRFFFCNFTVKSQRTRLVESICTHIVTVLCEETVQKNMSRTCLKEGCWEWSANVQQQAVEKHARRGFCCCSLRVDTAKGVRHHG